MTIHDITDGILTALSLDTDVPLYALSNKPDIEGIKYEQDGKWMDIQPGVNGRPTIYDKDILLYCTYHIMRTKRAGGQVSSKININLSELLRFTQRGAVEKNYTALYYSIARLVSTVYTTGGTSGLATFFSLLTHCKMEKHHGPDRHKSSSVVTLSDIVFNAIDSNEGITLNDDYFRLRKPLERRIYELAVRHCSQQPSWRIPVESLLTLSGSQSAGEKFRQMIADLIEANRLPEFRVAHDEATDIVTFSRINTSMR